MSTVIELVVPNVAEFNLRNSALELGATVASQFIEFGNYEAYQSVFWSDRKRVLILPAGYDPLWFEDIHRALEMESPPVVSPAHHTGLLVADLLRDGAALSSLRKHLSGNGTVHVVSWGATPQLYQLAAALRGCGLAVELDGVPEPDYWASLYLDSKMSCLDLARMVPEFRVPRAMTVTNPQELLGAIQAMLATSRRAIVKSMHGVGGQGSTVVSRDSSDPATFWQHARPEAFFRTYPLSVQQFVEHASGVGCPAVDIRVDDDGVGEIVTSAMTVEGHEFRSVNVGVDAVSPQLAERIIRLGDRIGVAAHGLGFRGWLCVDYVLGADAELYVTEINARRSGAMHGISLLHRWQAESTMTVSSHEMIRVSATAPVSYRQHVRPVFRRLWEAGVRAYPTTVAGLSWSDPMLAVLTAGATAAAAERIAREIESELNPVTRAASGVPT